MDNQECLLSLKGLNGILKIYNDRVTISRKTAMGFMMQGIKGDRDIYFKDIKSIEFKKATMLANGYIQFITNAELATNQKVGILGTSLEASKDPNAIIVRAFNKETVNTSVDAYELATSLLGKSKENGSTSPSKTNELREYKSLLDDGIITQEEFDAKKKELLK